MLEYYVWDKNNGKVESLCDVHYTNMYYAS